MTPDVETAMAEALHRVGPMECGPDTDDYDDSTEHRINAHDLLDSLNAHGWRLVKGQSPLDSFTSALAGMGGPAASERETPE